MSQPGNNTGTIVPAVHLEFIQNQIGLPEEAGIAEIETYHRALFLHHHAHELERFQQSARVHEERLAHLETRLRDTHQNLAGLEPLVPVDVDGQPDMKPSLPWNRWDLAMFIVAALGILCLLAFGVLNVSFNLLESGLVTFLESPIRAYFWAALLPVGALAVKVGWDFLQRRKLRDAYLWTCLALGVAGVLVWMAAYAAVYPTFSKTTQEHLNAMSVFDGQPGSGGAFPGTTGAGVKWIDFITVAAQATAEIFLSAVLGMYMTTIYLRHRPVRLAGNPLFLQRDEERRLLEESVERERAALAEAKGNHSRLENQLTALLSFARCMFQKEVAQRRDQGRQKRLMLDQISEQLRNQLQSMENGRASEDELASQVARPDRQNGR